MGLTGTGRIQIGHIHALILKEMKYGYICSSHDNSTYRLLEVWPLDLIPCPTYLCLLYCIMYQWFLQVSYPRYFAIILNDAIHILKR